MPIRDVSNLPDDQVPLWVRLSRERKRQREGQMRVICMWCKIVLKEGPSQPVSHGLCDTFSRGGLVFITPGRYASHQTRYVAVPVIVVIRVAGQTVHWRWEDESKQRKSSLHWTKVAMTHGQYHKEDDVKNRGLLSRAYKELGIMVYRLPEEDEARLQECLERAKRELGGRQVGKHDKWTSRVVKRAVNLYIDEGVGDE